LPPRAALLSLLLLAACAGSPPAPIEDRSAPGSPGHSDNRYRVQRGDTLFSIAFRYGLEFRRLAAANAIAPPYTIYVGQTLRLAEAEPGSVPAPAPAAKPGGGRPGTSEPASAAVDSAAKPTPARSKPAPPPAAVTRSAASDDSPVSAWRWPADGRLRRRFDGARHKGIDIAGERGATVRASAGGRVVYAGSGIAGYGLMLIVRHNDEFLSAYGHNDTLLVGENDAVRPGQPIARMGSSGTDSVKLHFELRRRGRPVDPLQLLPAR
jgi:lipoprotein NlpD